MPDGAGAGVAGLAGSSHSILQLGRAFWRRDLAGVILLCSMFRDVNCWHSLNETRL